MGRSVGPLLLLLLLQSAAVDAAVGALDASQLVARPAAWDGLFRADRSLADYAKDKAVSSVYGSGLAKGYVEECQSAQQGAAGSSLPDGHTCYRVYLVLSPMCRNVYARESAHVATLPLQRLLRAVLLLLPRWSRRC